MDINFACGFNLFELDCSVGADFLSVYNNKNIFYFDRKTGERVNMVSFFPSATLTITY